MKSLSDLLATIRAACFGERARPQGGVAPCRSIKMRVTVLSLLAFMGALWGLVFSVGHVMHEDIERILSEQQLETASILSRDVNDELNRRLYDLETVAAVLTVSQDAASNGTLQRQIENMLILRRQFNGGMFVVSAEGQKLAFVPGRVPGAVQQKDDAPQSLAVSTVLESARPTIGPVQWIEKTEKAGNAGMAAFHMAVPIRDAKVHERIVAVLVGVVQLGGGSNNFLDDIIKGYTGQGSADYLLVSTQQRLIISASDSQRIMESSPPPGRYPSIDRFLGGEEGSSLFVNPAGIEVLQSVRRVALTDWYVAVSMPAVLAFAPQQQMQQRMATTALLLSLLVGGLIWWLVRRQLTPVFDTLQALSNLADHVDRDATPQDLPVKRNDEIGQLVGGFNRLLAKIAQRESELRVSNELLEEAQRISHVGSWSFDQADDRLLLSQEACHLLERDPQETQVSRNVYLDAVHPEDMEAVGTAYNESLKDRAPYELVHRLQMPDGRIKWVRTRCVTEFDIQGLPVRSVGTIQDITEARLISNALREAKQQLASIIDHIPAMVFLKRADNLRFELFNQAGEAMLGYRAEDMIGRNDYDFFPPAQAEAFMARDREVLARQDVVEINEELITTAHGEIRHLYTRKVALRDTHGKPTHLLGISVDITERKQAEERINQYAFFDQITALPNRRLLLDRLQQAVANASRTHSFGALLFIDLDKFKTLNDTLGHAQGDLLLKHVAHQLNACVRNGDTVARLGDDEFVVMLVNIGSNRLEALTHTELVSVKILGELAHPFTFESGYVHHGTASVGATIFGGEGDEIDNLLRQADLAMYRAKAAGRNTVRFFDPSMETDIVERTMLESDLRLAIEQNQFELHYQVQMAHGEIVGTEALVRWRHPQRGMIPPGEFIPLAEETGMILPLGTWVLETACKQLTQWSTRTHLSGLSIAVNVSARQFRQVDFVDQVRKILEQTGADPRRLKLELTESLLVEDVEDIIEKMNELKQLGVSFSLDDFGTGYSSLYYLKHLPIEQMKIDQSFVRDILDDPNDAAIARTIVALAQSLGIGVIAEGVETKEQLNFLAGLECHSYQGYYFSKPLPVTGFEEHASKFWQQPDRNQQTH